MTTKTFLADADGVLLSWKEHFVAYAARYAGKSSLDTSRYDLGLTQDELTKLANRFNTSIEFGRITPFLDAKKYVQKIHEKGYRFVVITNCYVNEYSKILRERNLIEHFGPIFDEIYCLPYHSSKEEILKKYQPTIWIDDKLINCIAGVNAGHKSFILRQDHNKDDHHPSVNSVYTWKELNNLI